MLYRVILCYTRLYHVIPCHIMLYHGMSQFHGWEMVHTPFSWVRNSTYPPIHYSEVKPCKLPNPDLRVLSVADWISIHHTFAASAPVTLWEAIRTQTDSGIEAMRNVASRMSGKTERGQRNQQNMLYVIVYCQYLPITYLVAEFNQDAAQMSN